ncbi:hypothetical protein [Collimonas arenae]|uniref:hypothetical protein n=1 Tax=Collimonas arenae TaxID=279058 RepID=UPI000570976B|nr:hypothetical protein [Collimonas arenae]
MRRVILFFIILVSLAVSGCTTLADSRSAKGTGTARVYDATSDAIWTALPKIVKDVGLDYVGDNKSEGYALAQRGISAFSYGENVAMFIEPTSTNDKTRVEVVSKRALATTVFAKNWETAILDKLGTVFPPPGSGISTASHNDITPLDSPGLSSKKQSKFVPPASSFASINDVWAIPFVGPQARSRYMAFLLALPPKAFAIGTNGAWGWTSDDAKAMQTALSLCLARPGAQCWLYAVDSNVVWQSDENQRISLKQLDAAKTGN